MNYFKIKYLGLFIGVTMIELFFSGTLNAQTCVYSISPTYSNVGAGGGLIPMTVYTDGNCPYYSVSSNVPWIAYTRYDETRIDLSVDANTGSARQGVVTIDNYFTLTINQSGSIPQITANPISQTVCAGVIASFSISASNATSYQWQQYSGGTWQNINGATGTSYSTNTSYSMNGYRYKCAASNSSGTAYSYEAILNVNPLPNIPYAGNNISNCGPANLTLTATNLDGPGITHHWYDAPSGGYEIPGVVVSDPSGYTTSYTNYFSSHTTYYVSATNSCGTSSRVAVSATINAGPSVSITSNGSTEACSLNNNIILTATAGSSYQWKLNGNNISAYSQTYHPVSSGDYSVVVGTTCGPIQSNTVSVSIISPANLSVSINGPGTTCSGVNATYTATVPNIPNWVSYQWYVNNVPVGSNSSSYSTTALSNGNKVKCTVTLLNGMCATPSSYTSNEITVSVGTVPSVPLAGSNVSNCGPANLTLTATNLDGPGITHHWYDSAIGGNEIIVSQNYDPLSETTTSSKTEYFSTTTNFYVSASNSCGPSSRIAINAIINPEASISITPSSPPDKICEGDEFFLTASGGSLYEWRINTSTGIPVSTDVNFYPGITGDNIIYLTGKNYCDNVRTETIQIVITPHLTLPIAEPVKINYNSSTTLVAIGADPTTESYKWYSDLSGGYQITNLNTPSLTVTTDYFVTKYNVVSGCESKPRVRFTVRVRPYNNYNFIEETTILDYGIISTKVLPSLNVSQKNVRYDYFDGLGNLEQQVSWQASPANKDLIRHIGYDNFGRQKLIFLPYTSQYSDGNLRTNAISEQNLFYQSIPEFSSEIPYSETVFEQSPLNRIQQQGAPGTIWQPANGHAVEYKYEFNSASEVKRWLIVDNSTCQLNGTYTANQLRKNEHSDENGNTTIEFIDKEDRVVLKRSLNGIQLLETYYIYDNYDQLRYVITPKASQTLTLTTFDQTTPLIRELCYYYEYDDRGRLITKQLPGTDPVSMVYDIRDRLVLTQDGHLRETSKWFFTKYDIINRPVMTGIVEITDSLTQGSVQSIVDEYYLINNTSEANLYEIRETTSPGYTLNRSFPNSIAENELLTITYYDDYTFPNAYAYVPEANITSYNPNVKGKVTGGKVRMIESASWLKNTVYYDDKYSMIQSIKENLLGGSDRITYNIDFTGKITSSLTTHTGRNEISTIRTFEYDHAGRFIKLWHKIDNANPVLMSYMSYNELGQLIDKKIHSTDNNYLNYLQSTDYRYNIRGWLTHINNNDLGTFPTSDNTNEKPDVFGMELRYNVPF